MFVSITFNYKKVFGITYSYGIINLHQERDINLLEKKLSNDESIEERSRESIIAFFDAFASYLVTYMETN